MSEFTYTVAGMSCGGCRGAIETEVHRVWGVSSVEVDLELKRVTVFGDQLDDSVLRAASDDARYEATRSRYPARGR